MLDGGPNQTGALIVVVGSLAVAVSVVSLGMGFVNILSADAGARLSAFSLAHGNPVQNSVPAAGGGRKIADINYLREEITARGDLIAGLRREIDLASKQLDIQKTRRETLALAQNPDTTEIGGVPLETRAVAREIARIDSELAALRKRQENSERIEVARWFPARDPAPKLQFVECGRDGIVLQPQAARFSARDLQGGNGTFAANLTPGYVVLLLRPSGFESCAAVRKALDARGIGYGLAPVDEAWQLVFR